MHRPCWVVGALLLAWIGITLTSPVFAAPVLQPDCPGNLLVNGDFEGGSRKTEAEGTSLSSAVANGWVPWFIRGDEVHNREPEFKVEQVAIGGDPFRVRSGGQSQKFFTTWATHTAGFYQQVRVPRGATVRFTIYGMAYSGEADNFDPGRKSFLSDPLRPGNYRMWAGIDPTGAVPAGMGLPPPETVVWSEPTMITDQWVPLSITVRAQGGLVTVYTKGAPDWSVKHNDSFWEDACLVIVGRGGATGSAAAPTGGGGPAAASGGTTKGRAKGSGGRSGLWGTVRSPEKLPASL